MLCADCPVTCAVCGAGVLPRDATLTVFVCDHSPRSHPVLTPAEYVARRRLIEPDYQLPQEGS
jgi:hypothetical protein